MRRKKTHNWLRFGENDDEEEEREYARLAEVAHLSSAIDHYDPYGNQMK